MRNLIAIFILFSALFLVSCDPENVITQTKQPKTEQPEDYVWEDSNVKTITFNGSSISTNSKDVVISGTKATIKTAGYYLISGKLDDGQLIIDAPKAKLKLMLNGMEINNFTTSPFFINSASKVIIFLKTGTVSKLQDAPTYTNTGEPNAVISSNAYLAFTGDGTLEVNGKFNDGISSDDEIFINNGILKVSAVDDALRAKDFMVIHNGKIFATAVNGHALKVDSSGTAGYGYLKINGGEFNLSSTSADGIHAHKKIQIENGKFTIQAGESQALRCDSVVSISGGNIEISSTKQGIESPFINISGGTINMVTSKNAVYATFNTATTKADDSAITISGGNVYISTLGNGLASDGNIIISGSNTVIQGSNSSTKPMVKYLGSFNVSGGVFLGCATNTGALFQQPNATSIQNSVRISSALIGLNYVNVQDPNGNSLFTIKPYRAAFDVVFSSPELKTGSAYNVYTGGTYTGGTVVNNYFTGGSYSGGVKRATFTVTEKLTKVSF